MLPEIFSALQFMGTIILLLVLAVAALSIIVFKLYQNVRALREQHQALDYDASYRIERLEKAGEYLDEELKSIDSRVTVNSYRVAHLEFINDIEYVDGSEYADANAV